MKAACVLVCVCAVFQIRQEDKIDPEPGLYGTWELVELVDNGRKVPADLNRGTYLVISRAKLSVVSSDMEKTFRLYVRPEKAPKQMDTVPLGGPFVGQINPGIYELSGDHLRYCIPTQDSSERPSGFESKAGSKVSLMVFRRHKTE